MGLQARLSASVTKQPKESAVETTAIGKQRTLEFTCLTSEQNSTNSNMDGESDHHEGGYVRKIKFLAASLESEPFFFHIII